MKLKLYSVLANTKRKQESLANAKGSARQPWYIVRNSLNRPPLRIAQQYQRWQRGSIFIRLAVVASQTCQLAQNSAKIWTYSSSRSSKVDDFGTNRKRICHFLLVINSNFGPILHRFWDTATYWLKMAHFSYPSLIWLPRFPLEFQGAVKRQETRVMGLLCGEGCMILTSTVFDWSTRVTDRRTDRQTDGRWHIARYSIYAVAR